MAKPLVGGGRRRAGLRSWVVRVGTSIVIWTVVMQLMPILGPSSWQPRLPKTWPSAACLDRRDPLRPNASATMEVAAAALGEDGGAHLAPPALLPRRVYRSNGYLRVTCNGGLNQMRAAICDMVTVARHLNLTLVVPELDKTSFWADPSDFGDIFDVDHFINSLRDEVKIVRTLPQKIKRRGNREPLSMQPISWSSEKYYLRQILPLIRKHKVVHFNRTDARLANNGIPMHLQKLRCRVNYESLRFTPQIEKLGNKLVGLLLQRSASFVVLHLRYEMDMLAFSGCSHGCSESETEELTRMRYAYPWWKEKEIDSEKKRLDGLCPLTPEETALVLTALGFTNDTLIYIASGEIYGGEARMASLRAAYPRIFAEPFLFALKEAFEHQYEYERIMEEWIQVRKEMLLSEEELRPFRNHSTQMAALDYLVSVVSDVFIPTYDGNMAKVVEGHRRYTGFRKTILLDRRKIVELLDLLQDNELSWDEFVDSMRDLHKDRMGQPTRRQVLLGRPKEEDYFYSNPQECLAVPHRRPFSENMRDTDI